jgi:arylformamidase
MTVIDLSQVITESMPVYPGTKSPEIEEACTIEKDGFAEKRIRLYSHTGTHIDAPGHILAGASRLDDFDAGRFIGPGCALDVSACRGGRVDVGDLKENERRIAAAEFVLLRTGWAKHWGGPRYFADFPVLTEAAARWLAGFPLKGIGVDAISVDEMNSTAMIVHRTLLAANLLIIENLTGLEPLLGRDFLFSCLPLKLAGGDGSPIRAAALLIEE